jgi:hypothetical protein
LRDFNSPSSGLYNLIVEKLFYRNPFSNYEYVRKDLNKYDTSVIVISINIGVGAENFMRRYVLIHHSVNIAYNNEICKCISFSFN